MRAQGNGNPEVCVRNLLSIVQGENPYERSKGLSTSLTDTPVTQAGIVAAEVGQVLEEYEPRVDEEDIELTVRDVLRGSYLLHADVGVEG